MKDKEEQEEEEDELEVEDEEEEEEAPEIEEAIKRPNNSLQPPSKLDTIQSSNNTNGSESYRHSSEKVGTDSSLALGAYNRSSVKANEENQQMVVDSLESNKGPFQKNKNRHELSFEEEQFADKKHYSFQPVPLPELFDQMNYMS